MAIAAGGASETLAREAFAAGALWQLGDAQMTCACYDQWHSAPRASGQALACDAEDLRERIFGCQVAVQLPHVGETVSAVLVSDLRAILLPGGEVT